MTLIKMELKRNGKSLLIWSVVIGGMILLCLLLYPELKKEVDSLEEALKNMGGVTAAFGMDRLNYGELMGFYGIYGGSMLGIGGIFYSAILGAGMLAREEQEHTAEFLLTHPVSREKIFFQKLSSMAILLVLMNSIVILFSCVSFAMIGEKPDWDVFWIYHGAQVLMQMEILGICCGISAFIRRGSVSLGIGVAALLYFLGLFSNITDKAEAAKYLTPYAYADAAKIISERGMDEKLALLGIAYGLIGIGVGFWKYRRKDIS